MTIRTIRKCIGIVQTMKWERFGMDDRGIPSRISAGAKFWPFISTKIGSNGYPAAGSEGTSLLCPGIKRPVCEIERLLPSSAQIKNEWSYTSNLHLFMACTGTTSRLP